MDALVEELRQNRSTGTGPERDALIAELRRGLEKVWGKSKQASEKIRRLAAEVEAAVRASMGERFDEDIAHRLKVVESSLVGLSESVRGLEPQI